MVLVPIQDTESKCFWDNYCNQSLCEVLSCGARSYGFNRQSIDLLSDCFFEDIVAKGQSVEFLFLCRRQCWKTSIVCTEFFIVTEDLSCWVVFVITWFQDDNTPSLSWLGGSPHSDMPPSETGRGRRLCCEGLPLEIYCIAELAAFGCDDLDHVGKCRWRTADVDAAKELRNIVTGNKVCLG